MLQKSDFSSDQVRILITLHLQKLINRFMLSLSHSLFLFPLFPFSFFLSNLHHNNKRKLVIRFLLFFMFGTGVPMRRNVLCLLNPYEYFFSQVGSYGYQHLNKFIHFLEKHSNKFSPSLLQNPPKSQLFVPFS